MAMSRTRAILYGLVIAVFAPITIAAAYNSMADRPRTAALIVAGCILAAFVTGLILMAIKLREGGAAMGEAGAQPQEIRAYYRSALGPTVWMIFKAALIGGPLISLLAMQVFALKF